MVVQVLVPKAEPINPLPDKRQHRVLQAPFASAIDELFRNGLGEAQLAIDLCKEEGAAIAGDGSAVEAEINFPPFDVWKT
jgi:hypothetical protein